MLKRDSKKNWHGTETTHINCNLLLIKDRRKLSLLIYAHIQPPNWRNLKEHHVCSLRSNRKIPLTWNVIQLYWNNLMWQNHYIYGTSIRKFKTNQQYFQFQNPCNLSYSNRNTISQNGSTVRCYMPLPKFGTLQHFVLSDCMVWAFYSSITLYSILFVTVTVKTL